MRASMALRFFGRKGKRFVSPLLVVFRVFRDWFVVLDQLWRHTAAQQDLRKLRPSRWKAGNATSSRVVTCNKAFTSAKGSLLMFCTDVFVLYRETRDKQTAELSSPTIIVRP